MFKNILAPVQAWLLSQGRCVGCGTPLDSSKTKNGDLVTCKCGRVYVYDSESGKFRRALLSEV